MDKSINLDKIMIRSIQQTDAKSFFIFEKNIIEEQLLLHRKDTRSQEECEWMIKHMFNDVKNLKGVVNFAEYEEHIVGYAAIFRMRQKCDHIGDFGIMITKEFRNSGLGTKLSLSLLNEMKTQIKDIEVVQLGVFANNLPAIKLYQKLGFKEVARIPKKIKHNDEYIDELIMHFWLK